MTARRVVYILVGLGLAAAACGGGATTGTTNAPPTSQPEEPPATTLPPIGPDAWPTFRLATSRVGTTGSATGTPEPAWTFDTGGVVESSPAIVDGVVYVGTFAGRLHALDAATGAELWAFPVGGLLRASPSVIDGVV